jgi:predicted dehydrogenase
MNDRPAPSDIVSVALVGLGYWGPNLARNLAALRGARLHTLCDQRADRLTAYGSQYPAAVARGEYDEVLSDPAVDAVVLATPAGSHFVMAKAALEAGKHVLVEKPMAKTSDECRELIGIASDRGLTLMVGHVFLFNAAVRRIKEYIESGELGDIYYAYSQRLNLGQVYRDVNALWNFAPHDFSILGYWLGSEPERVVARGYAYVQPAIEDVVFMTLDYPGGVGANVHISWLDPLKVRRMTVVGSRKMVVFDEVSPDQRVTLYDRGIDEEPAGARAPRAGARAPRGRSSLGRYETFGEYQLLLRAGDVVIPRIDFVEPLKLQCQHFVDRIVDGEKPLTDGASGLAVVKALEAAQRSIDTARPVVID